jgi:hypothetical protein
MKKQMGLILAASLPFFGVGLAQAATPEDDLAVVQKALQKSPEPAKTGAKPTWLHIRVEGKTNKTEKVSINVPFAVVEALGDEEIHFHGRDSKGERKALHLSEILKSLEAGQQLVEVDSEEETVRIWVD